MSAHLMYMVHPANLIIFPFYALNYVFIETNYGFIENKYSERKIFKLTIFNLLRLFCCK